MPELQAELDQLATGQLTFLVTHLGKAFRPAGFGNWFHDMAAEAGLPSRYNTHDCARQTPPAALRPAGPIMKSWRGGGWTSLSEVQRYTRAANRKKLAKGTVHKLTTRKASGKPN